MLFLNELICGDAAIELKKLLENSIDLTVTSPPYDDKQKYHGYSFDFETIARELFRVTKQGGVVCWNIKDKKTKGNLSLTSFRHALEFQKIGFLVNDIIIYGKKQLAAAPPTINCYWDHYEFVIVLTKGKHTTFNPIIDHKNKYAKSNRKHTARYSDNHVEYKRKKGVTGNFSKRGNIWYYSPGWMKSTKDEIAYNHPAIMPEDLAKDCILSWSNPGDLILDPFAGSGTTLKMARLNRRNYIGIEISEEYCNLANKRLDAHDNQSLEVFS